jgi:putative ABC transport system substrate-binding protein
MDEATPAARGRDGLLMQRRAFIGAIAGALFAAPRTTDAQQNGKAFLIGILANVRPTESEGTRLWGAFIEGLRELGYVEGRNIRIEWRISDGKYERLPALAAELVRLDVDVIIVPADQNAAAVKRVTSTIPIVMTGSADPVGSGLVASLARPGGNITGLSILAPEMAGKQLALLKELVPRISRVAVLWNPTNPGHALSLEEAKGAARSLGVQLEPVEARSPDEFNGAFAAMTRARAGAILVLWDGMFLIHQRRIIDLTATTRLPAMYQYRGGVAAGGLMAYGPSNRDGNRRAAGYVDKILRGAKPADLPIEQPTTFELVINLGTAKALGLVIPQPLLARADEVIQ